MQIAKHLNPLLKMIQYRDPKLNLLQIRMPYDRIQLFPYAGHRHLLSVFYVLGCCRIVLSAD